jgi:transposase
VCPCCGDSRLRKIGEDVTETLEHVPACWKVIQHVREKFSCRSCETIAQTPAPSHPIARGRAGPFLLAHILFCKYGLHLPLTRQSATYAREGVELDVSTLADWVGAASATLMPLVEAIRAHVFAAERIHADDTTVPVLAKGKCRTGRLWTYVRDDRPFAGTAAPAAAFFYSADRGGVHPDAHLAGYAGLMQADAYAGFNRLYEAGRKPGPIVEAMCWAHARRKFFDLARLNKAPIAIEAVERIDALFPIERDINGKPPWEHRRIRSEHSKPLVIELEKWLRQQRAKLSARNQVAKAIAYSLNCWSGLTRFLDDGRLCMSNNAAERRSSEESARFAEAEHHLRGALSRTHRKIVARIHQRVAFGFEHKSRCGYFALDDLGIDAVQRLRIARARSSRRNIVGYQISASRFEGRKNGPVHGVGVGGELTHVLEVVVVLRNPSHIHRIGSPNLAERLFDLRNVAVGRTGDDRINAGFQRFVEGWQICGIDMPGGPDGLGQEPGHIASPRNEL